MKLEVLFMTTARIAKHKYPEVVQYEDGPLVRALLKAGHVELIDPPFLAGYNEHELEEVSIDNGKQEPSNLEPIGEKENESLY